jgi:hypothetical protein
MDTSAHLIVVKSIVVKSAINIFWRPAGFVRTGCLVCMAATGMSCAVTADTPLAPESSVVWHSGFENGYPGEWLDWPNNFNAEGTLAVAAAAAWTIAGSDRGTDVPSGESMYKAWIVGPAQSNHRPYPVLHAGFPTPLVNSFLVYIDTDYSQLSPTDWISVATWGNWDTWGVHTMSVRDRRLEFAHTEPFSGEYIGPQPWPDFPLRTWVRFTVYMHYRGSNGFVQVWQDGVPMLRAEIPALQQSPGTTMDHAHWGLYTNPGLSNATMYNDDIVICTLSAPLTDFATEPLCGESLPESAAQ